MFKLLCTPLIKLRRCAPCRVPNQIRVPEEMPAPIAHHLASQEGPLMDDILVTVEHTMLASVYIERP